jgi:penicillin-binding protein 1C
LFKKVIIGLIIGFFCILTILGLIVAFYPLPAFFGNAVVSETTKIYDRKGQLLYELLLPEQGRSTYQPLSRISPYLIQGMVAVEDQDFFTNMGIDLSSMLRAIWQNIMAQEIVSGGSTITQQLMRNVFHAQRERNFSTKFLESIYALRLTWMWSKSDILEQYLNVIYFGNLAYGAEAAARTYFGKSAAQLDLAEGAFLAGLPQAPSKYDPYHNFDLAKARQEIVLQSMFQLGVITKEDLEIAQNEVLKINPKKANIKAPHFVQYLLPRLEAKLGVNKVHYGGLKIFTTLDLSLQEEVQKLVQRQLAKLQKNQVTNAAVLVLTPENGEILVMLGSADYFNSEIEGEYNVVLGSRQPGSAIKPLVYLAAFEQGMVPSTVIEDQKTRFITSEGLPYTPQNFDLKYHGMVTLREALGSSLNIPAVKILHQVGVEKVIAFARRMGIASFNKSADHFGLAFALGGAEIKFIELMQFYAILANEGKQVPLKWLNSIQEKTGEEQWTEIVFTNPAPKTVVKKEYVYLITDILADNTARITSFGEDNILKTNYPSAVKTGTTRNFKDNWTLGYTPQRVVGVWVGNNDNTPMRNVSGITGAGPLWRKIMDLVQDPLPPVNFKKPSQITSRVVCLQQKCKQELFLKNATSIDPIDLNPSSSNQLGVVTERGLIDNPLPGAIYQIDPEIPLDKQKVVFKSEQEVDWLVDGEKIGQGTKISWQLVSGQHIIKARGGGKEEELSVYVR